MTRPLLYAAAPPCRAASGCDCARRVFPSDSLEIEVKLWYLPYGTFDDDAFPWREEKRTVQVATTGQ